MCLADMPRTLCSRKVQDALDVFSEEELRDITAFYSWETGEFEGLGFVNEAGKFAKFANPEKVAAIEILESEYLRYMIDYTALLSEQVLSSRMGFIRP